MSIFVSGQQCVKTQTKTCQLYSKDKTPKILLKVPQLCDYRMLYKEKKDLGDKVK